MKIKEMETSCFLKLISLSIRICILILEPLLQNFNYSWQNFMWNLSHADADASFQQKFSLNYNTLNIECYFFRFRNLGSDLLFAK